MVRNPRGAGRKATLSQKDIEEVNKRYEGGEKLLDLAREYGVSRQTLSKYINKLADFEYIYTVYRKWVKANADYTNIDLADYTIRINYYNYDSLCTVIFLSPQIKGVKIFNETDDILHRAFGIKAKPNWEDVEEFLEDRCVAKCRWELKVVLDDYNLDGFDLFSILEKTHGRMAEDHQSLDMYFYNKYAI